MAHAHMRAPASKKRRTSSVLRRQYDVITYDQLLECGWAASGVARAFAGGDFIRPYRGVYIDAAAPVRPESRLLAACFAGGGDSVASHRGAAWIWRLTEKAFIEITRALDRNGALPGCVVHRATVMPRRVVRRGIPCTDPLRTMVDLASVLDGDDLWLAFARGVSSRLFTPDGVRAANDRLRSPGRTGSAAIDGVVAELGPVSLESPSVLQLAFARLIARTDLEWPQAEVPVPGTRYRLDYAYPDVRFAIELHGFDVHGDPLAAAEGHRRVREIMAQGWNVAVFTWNDVWNHPARTEHEVRTELTRLRRLTR